MANLNDFKLVALKSKKMFEFINAKKICDDIEKSRLGFYHLVLENITGIRDIDRIQEIIIDSRYNELVFDCSVNDLGMDAVNIVGDEEVGEVTIQLFNFKYRNKFNPDKTKEEESLSRSTKYLEYMLNEDDTLNNLQDDKVQHSLQKIKRLLNSNVMCNIILYMVSNEANGFSMETNNFIKILEKSYGMKVQTISLDDIVGYFVSSRSEKRSRFVIAPNDFLSFEKDNMSTQKSYVLKLSLIDLIRITCNNDELGDKYNMEDDEQIKDQQLDYALLYDNVRGYLGETNYNANIIKTLQQNYKEFFMLNNGLTFTATGVDAEPINSGNKYLFAIRDFQIVNGGQTIRAIYNYLNSDSGSNTIKKLRETYVLVRIFKIPVEDELKNRIAEYTNSQNAIASSDLKSVDKIQIQIENYLKEEQILYIRKAGQFGEDNIEYKYRISKEKTAQILYSAFGFPDRASNQKKRLFQEYYNEIFKSDKFTLEKVVECVKLYYKIEEVYKNFLYDYFELKNYYIIYLVYRFNMKIVEAIGILEKAIESNPEKMPPARMLIRNKFKLFVENFCKEKEHQKH